MAFSQPLSGSLKNSGQTALMCQLCENNPKLKWKCLDCELMMCQRCRDKVHKKIASAQDHKIIDIREISKYQTNPEWKMDPTKLICEAHPEKYCSMYCKTCRKLVCLTCIAKTHNKHDFGEMFDEYQNKREQVRKRQKEIEKEKRNLIASEQKLKQIKSNEQSNYDKVKKEILDYQKALVNQIKQNTKKLLKDLDQKWEACSNSVKNEEKNLKEKQPIIQEQIKKINHLLQPCNIMDVFSDSYSISKSEWTKTGIPFVNKSFKGVPKFTHGDKMKLSLTEGKLEDVTIQYNTELQLDKTFETDFRGISSVETCIDGSLWIFDSPLETIQRVQPTGDNLKVTLNFKKNKIKPCDIACLPSGDLLFSVHRSSTLKLLPSSSTDIRDSIYTVSPLQPIAVHVTSNNKVIVGAVEAHTIPGAETRQVIEMDQTGYHDKVFQRDRHNQLIFTYPNLITSNSQGYTAVLDMISDDLTGRMVLLDQGGVCNIYTGHPEFNNEDEPFRPTGITATPSDNFVVAETSNHTLHILNIKGEIITFYNTEEIGIPLPPCSLAFSTTGQFYIGCGSYYGRNEKTKLFIVNNFLL